ncbi:MAG TPA: GNAT family N-acetyltransferase [Longimicrobium sp.]
MGEIEIRRLGEGDAAVLGRVLPDVFDHEIDPAAAAAFLSDPHHHLVVAIEDGAVIGFASAIDYFHPDKPRPELWIDEVGVAPERHGRGVGKAVVRGMLDVARAIGCGEAWVLTDRDNAAAMRLYASTGGEESDAVMFTFSLDEGGER